MTAAEVHAKPRLSVPLPRPLGVKVAQLAGLQPGPLDEIVDLLPPDTKGAPATGVSLPGRDYVGGEFAAVDQGMDGSEPEAE